MKNVIDYVKTQIVRIHWLCSL